MRGNYKGKTGEVIRIDRKHVKAYVGGIDIVKKDGTKVSRPIDPSNLMITELKIDDKYRVKSLERK